MIKEAINSINNIIDNSQIKINLLQTLKVMAQKSTENRGIDEMASHSHNQNVLLSMV